MKRQSMIKQKGFTLIEIGIVLFVVGILVAIFLPTFTQGIRDRSRAESIIVLSKKTLENIKTLAQSCNKPVDTIMYSSGYTDITGAAPYHDFFVGVITTGDSIVSNTYKYCYQQANVVFNGFHSYSIAGMDSTKFGLMQAQGMPFTVAVLNNPPPTMAWYGVPYEIAIEVVKQMSLDPTVYTPTNSVVQDSTKGMGLGWSATSGSVNLYFSANIL